MRRCLVRLFAIVLILGQLAQVSGGALCALPGRDQVAHCDDGTVQPGGSSVTAPMDGMDSAFCNLMGPCGAPVSAVTAPVVNHIVLAETHLAAVAAAIRPASFHAAPIPPPPQV